MSSSILKLKNPQQTITQKMSDQEQSDVYVVFTMILCEFKVLEMLTTSLPELIWVSNQKLVRREAI